MYAYDLTLTKTPSKDLVLDTPDAADVLAKFLARAIVDEIVPPAFLKNAHLSTPRAEEVIALASGLTTERHRIDRLARILFPLTPSVFTVYIHLGSWRLKLRKKIERRSQSITSRVSQQWRS